MIDWVVARLPCTHNPDMLYAGHIESWGEDGTVEWVTEKRFSVEGSYSSKIQLRSAGSNQIWISGNPVKFLQGHNLFGSSDLKNLMIKFFKKLVELPIGLCPNVFEWEMICTGDYEVSRVDVNETWHLKDRAEVLAFIRALGDSSTMQYRGRGQFSGDTLYFGKNSRRWGLKCYSKGKEIGVKGHKLPSELSLPEMVDYAEKALRIELVMRQMELKRLGLNMVKAWDMDTGEVLLLKYISQLQISDVCMLKDDVLDTLPPRLRLTYQAWLNGDDLKAVLPQRTYYHYRRQLREYGIDISSPSPKEKTNVIPLIRVLEAKPVGIPDWAYEKGLVA